MPRFAIFTSFLSSTDKDTIKKRKKGRTGKISFFSTIFLHIVSPKRYPALLQRCIPAATECLSPLCCEDKRRDRTTFPARGTDVVKTGQTGDAGNSAPSCAPGIRETGIPIRKSRKKWDRQGRKKRFRRPDGTFSAKESTRQNVSTEASFTGNKPVQSAKKQTKGARMNRKTGIQTYKTSSAQAVRIAPRRYNRS